MNYFEFQKGRTIAVDVDEVVANLHDEWLRRYNNDYNDDLTKEEIKTWFISNYTKPECGEKMLHYLHDPDLYDNITPIEGALDGINYLRSQGHRVIFASSCVYGSEMPKLNWLFNKKFLKRDPKNDTCKDWISIADKSLIRTDMLIDDRYTNCTGFMKSGGFVSFLFDAHTNQQEEAFPKEVITEAGSHISYFPKPVRIQGWKDIYDIF